MGEEGELVFYTRNFLSPEVEEEGNGEFGLEQDEVGGENGSGFGSEKEKKFTHLVEISKYSTQLS